MGDLGVIYGDTSYMGGFFTILSAGGILAAVFFTIWLVNLVAEWFRPSSDVFDNRFSASAASDASDAPLSVPYVCASCGYEISSVDAAAMGEPECPSCGDLP